MADAFVGERNGSAVDANVNSVTPRLDMKRTFRMVTMRQPRSPALWIVGVTAVLLTACSGTPTPTAGPSGTPAPSPTPSPTPLPPDTMSVSVLGLGIGTFDLAAFPVA